MSVLQLRLRERVVGLRPGEPLLMGIVNASPESFSDGAEVGGLERQVELARQLVADGAGLIDVGGESGVTDLPPISAEEEARRVVPLVEWLAGEGIAVSIDTWKAEVAGAAIEAGAVMVNDVSGLADPGIADACATSGAALVVMHTRVPPKQKRFPAYADVTADVREMLVDRIGVAKAAGVGEDQLVIDPGPDFAKTPGETVEVLRRLGELSELRRPVLYAVSRKDFVGAITGRRPRERLAGTLAAIGWGVDSGASILRVHDVAEVRDYLAVRRALRGDAPAGELELPLELRHEARRSG